jgi:hypothetical protein
MSGYLCAIKPQSAANVVTVVIGASAIASNEVR